MKPRFLFAGSLVAGLMALVCSAAAQESLWLDLSKEVEALYARREYAPAYDRAVLALSVAEQSFGGEDLRVAVSLCNLALMQYHKGELNAAERGLRRALALRMKALGPEHPDVDVTLTRLLLLKDRMRRPAADSGGDTDPFARYSYLEQKARLASEEAASAKRAAARLEQSLKLADAAQDENTATVSRLRKGMEEAQDRVRGLQLELEGLKKTLADEQKARAEADSAVATASGDLARFRSQWQEEKRSGAAAAQEAESLREKLARDRDELALAREELSRQEKAAEKDRNAAAESRRAMDRVSGELRTAKAEVARLGEHVAEMQAQLARRAEELKAASDGASAALLTAEKEEKRALAAERQLVELREKLSTGGKQAQNLQAELEQKTREAKKAADEVATLHRDLEKALSGADDAGKALAELRAKLSAAESGHAAAVARSDARAKRDLAARDRDLEAARQELAGAKAELASLRKDRESAAGAMEAARAESAALREAQGRFQRELAAKDQELTAMRRDLEAAVDARAKAETASKSARDDLSAQRALGAQAAKLLADVRDEMAAAAARDRQIQGDRDRAVQEAQSLRTQMQARDKELEAARNAQRSSGDAVSRQLAQLESVLRDSEAEKAKSRVEIQALRAELEAARVQSREQTAMAATFDAARKEAEAKLGQRLQQATESEGQLAAAKQESAAARLEIENLQKAYERLQKKWEETSRDLTSARASSVDVSQAETKRRAAEEELAALKKRQDEASAAQTAETRTLRDQLAAVKLERESLQRQVSSQRDEATRLKEALEEQTVLYHQARDLSRQRERELLDRLARTEGAAAARGTRSAVEDAGRGKSRHPIRTWQYRNGTSLQASFISQAGRDIFVLEQADGVRVAVSRSSLSADDQKYVEGLLAGPAAPAPPDANP